MPALAGPSRHCSSLLPAQQWIRQAVPRDGCGRLHPELPSSALSLSSGMPPAPHLQPPQLQPPSALCKASVRNLGCRGTAELPGAPLTLNDHSSFAQSYMTVETLSSGTRRADVTRHQQHRVLCHFGPRKPKPALTAFSSTATKDANKQQLAPCCRDEAVCINSRTAEGDGDGISCSCPIRRGVQGLDGGDVGHRGVLHPQQCGSVWEKRVCSSHCMNWDVKQEDSTKDTAGNTCGQRVTGEAEE